MNLSLVDNYKATLDVRECDNIVVLEVEMIGQEWSQEYKLDLTGAVELRDFLQEFVERQQRKVKT